MLTRLDAELVRRQLARSRTEARELIKAGSVLVNGIVCEKSARQVAEGVSIKLRQAEQRWVSRGAHKLLGAISCFQPGGLVLAGKVALDAGASTGGFTQVLLRGGVSHVIAVDVGYGQLAWELRNDPRVTVMERVNVRGLEAGQLPVAPDIVVADLSFISLKTVLPALASCAAVDADLLLMVKPQFEVGRESIGDGVVRDPQLRKTAVLQVVQAAQALGLGLLGVCASPLPGPEGNVEYFIWLRKGAPCAAAETVDSMTEQAVAGGPQ